MTINKQWLKKTCESMWVHITKEQERRILEQFGTEPEPYEWSEQDICIQIRNFLWSGEFVKSMPNDGGKESVFLLDNDF
jgi:hypothetical protein